MGLNTILLFITFSSLTLLILLNEEKRKLTFSRNRDEWTADIFGLLIQGIAIPAFPFFVVPLSATMLPSLHGRFDVHPVAQFLLSFVLVDYLYYWNHRFFHGRKFWAIHRLHHSSRHLDLFATSRNSFITSFLFVYVWAQIGGMLLLKDSTPFMMGLAVTFALDLWRHSGHSQPDLVKNLFGWFLILPEQHVFHHSLTGRTKNYGANLNWWDKLHGTYSEKIIANRELEKISGKNIWSELFIPWRSK
ncbi:MAG: sterol desaturase family protein [Bacteriovoracia bacterium]